MAALSRVPKKSTLSAHGLTLDASLCQRWHREWNRLLQPSPTGQFPAIFYSADSSPQFGRDWFLQEITIVEDVEAAAALQCTILQALPRGNLSEQEWESWAASQDRASLSLLLESSRKLCQSVKKHSLIPTGLASQHGSALHKLHNMLHAMHMDTGSWSAVTALCDNIVGIVTDRGAERLLDSTPLTIAELNSLGFFAVFRHWVEITRCATCRSLFEFTGGPQRTCTSAESIATAAGVCHPCRCFSSCSARWAFFGSLLGPGAIVSRVSCRGFC